MYQHTEECDVRKRMLLSVNIWAAPSEFVSSSIPSWQILTAHAQPFRRARDLAFCLKVPLDSLLIWASSGGSGETARMRRLAWTFAARIGDKYQIRLARPIFILLPCHVIVIQIVLLGWNWNQVLNRCECILNKLGWNLWKHMEIEPFLYNEPTWWYLYAE